MLKRINLPLVGILLALALVALGAYVADWRQIGRAFADADIWLMLLSLPFLIATFIVFAGRWQQLIAGDAPLPGRELFSFLMIGYLGNAILPARPGDVIRAVLLRQRYGIGMSLGLASIVLERLIDLAAVCVIGVVLSFLIPLPSLILTAIYAVSMSMAGLLVVLLLVNWRRASFGSLSECGPRIFRNSAAAAVFAWLDRFVTGINVLSSAPRFAASMTLTAVGWVLLAAFIMSLIAAFRLPVPLSAGLLVLIATSLGALMPLSPGAVGVYHFMAVISLALWGIDSSTAIAFAIAAHAIAIGLHVGLGITCAMYEGIRVGSLTTLSRMKDAA